ncbi:MAG: GLPGLI family protein [Saprospiraceae bacterium]|nr:GLPGLI family protein [Saprospiraceae bacterium]
MKYLFFFISLNAFSQSLLIEYDWRMRNVSPMTQEYIFNDSLSLYAKHTILHNRTVYEFTEKLCFMKDKKRDALYISYFEPLLFKGAKYVKETIPNFSWELLSDTLTILKQKCFAAKTHFRGRDYMAFYAPSIPLPDGPWKFGGLPGLILKVNSLDEDEVTWIATRLESLYLENIETPDITKYTYFTWEEFVKSYAEDFKKFSKRSRSRAEESGLQIEGVKSEINIPSIEFIYPGLHTGAGAEY